MENKIIIIEENIDKESLRDFEEVYSRAEFIFATSPNEYSKLKFRSLYGKEIYFKIIDNYVNHINNELSFNYNKLKIEILFILNYFHYNIKDPFFFVFSAVEIKKIYPDYKIIIATSNKIIKDSKEAGDFDELKEIEVYYKSKDKPNISSIIKRTVLSFLSPKNKSAIIFMSFLKYVLFLIDLFKFKLKYHIKPDNKPDILFLSAGFRWWSKHKDNRYCDYYYVDIIDKISFESDYDAWVMTCDITFNKDLVKYSIFSFLNFSSLVKISFYSLNEFIKTVPYLKTKWLIKDSDLIKKIFLMKSMEALLKILTPKAVIYYDEVYISGRMLTLVLNKSGIDSYGFQHGLDSYYYPTYKFFKFYNEIPQIFPRYFLLYGTYFEELYYNYGFPKEKMIKIGFHRIDLKKTYSDDNKFAEKVNVLYLGDTGAFNELFEELYRKKDRFPIKKLFFRPHPGSPFDKYSFSEKYPDVILIDSKTLDLNKNIEENDCIFCTFGTSLVNAIYQRKIVICWFPYSLDTEGEYVKYWDVQVVGKLEEVDWTKRANPDNVIKEITPEVDLVTFLKSKY